MKELTHSFGFKTSDERKFRIPIPEVERNKSSRKYVQLDDQYTKNLKREGYENRSFRPSRDSSLRQPNPDSFGAITFIPYVSPVPTSRISKQRFGVQNSGEKKPWSSILKFEGNQSITKSVKPDDEYTRIKSFRPSRDSSLRQPNPDKFGSIRFSSYSPQMHTSKLLKKLKEHTRHYGFQTSDERKPSDPILEVKGTKNRGKFVEPDDYYQYARVLRASPMKKRSILPRLHQFPSNNFPLRIFSSRVKTNHTSHYTDPVCKPPRALSCLITTRMK